MRWWLLLCVGCGRLGFDASAAAADASIDLDGPVGSPVDGAAVDAPPGAGDDASTSGLLLWFELEALVDGVTLDSTSGVAATCAAPRCPTVRAGRIGDALDFGGSDEVRIAWDPAFETPKEFTIAAWFFSVGADGAIFSRPHSLDIWNTWQLEIINGDGTPAFTTSDLAGEHNKLQGPQLDAGVWSHLAGAWDGATKTLYVNGAPVATRPLSDVVTDELPLVIGFDINSGSNQLHVTGGIDDVRLYDRALSPAEIAALAALGE